MSPEAVSLAKQALARQDLELIRRNMARTQRFIARQDISNVARSAAEDRLSDLEFERDTVQMALEAQALPVPPMPLPVALAMVGQSADPLDDALGGIIEGDHEVTPEERQLIQEEIEADAARDAAMDAAAGLEGGPEPTIEQLERWGAHTEEYDARYGDLMPKEIL